METQMAGSDRGIGNVVAPWRYLVFALLFLATGAAGWTVFGATRGVLGGFDIAALAFIVSCAPMFRHEADDMRASARRNDANRVLILILSAAVMAVIMVLIGGELVQASRPAPVDVALIVATLILSWLFSNLAYALHYAHLYYLPARGGGDSGGIEIPDTKEPDYWDFAYFSSCIGMTFQTSDSDVTSRAVRRTVMFHAVAAFAFNLGVIAFTINVLGSG
jgi:uncharacterized membrane protein